MAETTSEPIKEIGGREGVLRVHGDGRELSGVIVNSLEGEEVNNGEATYAAWVYANENAVNPETFDYPNIFDNISNKLSLTQSSQLYYGSSAYGEGSAGLAIAGPSPLDEWVHIVSTVTQSSTDPDLYNPKIYINGKTGEELDIYSDYGPIQENRTFSLENPLLIGGFLRQWHQLSKENFDPWNGAIDEFQVWNRSLEHSEIIDLFENGVKPSSSLVADYDLNTVDYYIVFVKCG